VKHFAKLSRRVLVYVFVTTIAALFVPRYVWGQDLGSLRGTVTDPSGAAMSGAKITATDLASSVPHVATTGKDGGYNLTQLSPGDYKVEIAKDGFKRYVQARVSVLVATPTLLDARLELGSLAQEVVVESAAAPTINTEDATVGNTFNEEQVKDLPILARNVVNLLTIQPGVVFTGMSDTDQLNMGSIATLDSREGVVDGMRGNQTNVTVDGEDSNDWQNQSAFTTALPVTLDSVQEFRVITTNANATEGLTGGAQVEMVTKSGTDNYHGSAYWYYRTTGTSANSWFNNDNTIGRPKLQRNLAGGSVGGPIKKNRLFFFLNNEDRRDATAIVQLQTVPSDSLRDGILIYQCATTSTVACPGMTVQGLTATHTIAQGYWGIPTVSSGSSNTSVQQLDPAGIGLNPAMVPYMSLFPHGNDAAVGDDASGTGVVANFIGYRFNAPVYTFNNIYIARFDYNLTQDGHHAIFVKGALQGLQTGLVGAQFPGEAPAQDLLNNSRGFVVQYQGQLSSTVVNTARYGFTREGIAFTGTIGPQFDVRDFTDVENYGTRPTSRIVPVHLIGDDVSKTKGAHTIQFGGDFRLVTNDRVNESESFPEYFVNDGFDVGGAAASNEILANANSATPTLPVPTNPTAITRAFNMLTAPISEVNATYFGNPTTGAILPQGSPEDRTFAERSFEIYGQDSWRMRSNLTFTLGLRYGYETPVWETHGSEVVPSVDIMTWFKQRVENMDNGIPSSASPLLSWVLGGKANHGANSWYRPDYKDFAPRLALAYSPNFDQGIGNFLFGTGGKSSIRLGAGIFYDNIGQPIAVSSDLNGSPGTATALTDGSQQFCLGGNVCPPGVTPAPRFSGTCSLTAGCTGFPSITQFFTPPVSATFPFTPAANTSNLGFAVDPGLRTPYSMHFNADIQRELPHHFVLDVGYVGVLGRRLLGKIDFAQYLDIKDTASGQDMWTAYRQIAALADMTPQNSATPKISPTILVNNVAEPNVAGLSAIQSVPFFTHMLPNMPAFAAQWFCSPGDATCNNGYTSLTPTQAFYAYAVQDALGLSGGPSWSCALYPLDTAESFYGLSSPWNTTVDPNGTGFVQFQPQFSSLPGWTNWASSNYHSVQISVRKSVGIASFAANYVFSKSIDNASGAENVDLTDGGSGTLGALIQNPFNHRLGRAVSDFNLKNNFDGDYVIDLPFGSGRRFFSSAGRAIDALVGGWQMTGAVRWHSGFPESPSNGFNFPTNFFLTTDGTLTGPVKSSLTRRGANGVPNLFSNPTAAFANFDFTPPGLPGSRNVIAGPAYAATDVGINKNFRITERLKLQLGVSAYNVFNSVNFSDANLSLDPTSPGTFGNLTGTAGPRGGAREMEFNSRLDF
jgi:Carboxypeptidase regulatory-like domain